MRKKIDQAAKEVLLETKNPRVMWGDCGLLDMIARRTGNEKYLDMRPTRRHRYILNALSKSSFFDKFVVYMKPGYRGNQYCRSFSLKERKNDVHGC